jgi:DNA-binding transcriptional regulator YiaG
LSIGATNIEETLMLMGPVRASRPASAENDVPVDHGHMQASGALTRNRNAVSLRGMSEQSYLSEAIRAARRRAGLSQAELAAALGVRQSSVSQWERGSTRPSTDHLLALTSILRTTLLDFSAVAAGTGEGAGGEGPAAGRAGAAGAAEDGDGKGAAPVARRSSTSAPPRGEGGAVAVGTRGPR